MKQKILIALIDAGFAVRRCGDLYEAFVANAWCSIPMDETSVHTCYRLIKHTYGYTSLYRLRMALMCETIATTMGFALDQEEVALYV